VTRTSDGGRRLSAGRPGEAALAGSRSRPGRSASPVPGRRARARLAAWRCRVATRRARHSERRPRRRGL